jgi:hypothetical protein
VRLPRGDSVSIFDSQLRLANTAEAYEGNPSTRLGTSVVDLVEEISMVDEIGVAGEGNGRGRRRRRFRSF